MIRAAMSLDIRTGSNLSQSDPVFDGAGLLAAVLEVLAGPDEPNAAPAVPKLTPFRGARNAARRRNYPSHLVPTRLPARTFAKS